MSSTLEHQIHIEGKEIFSAINNNQESVFDKQYWLGRMMEWVIKDPSFKVDLFRFVDVLPALNTDEKVAQHIKEYLIDRHKDAPLFMGGALKAASFSLTRGLAAQAIRKNVTELAERFILGSDMESATKALLKIRNKGFSYTIDLLGEKALGDNECNSYAERYKEIILALPKIGSYTSDDPPNVSIKVSALSANLKEEDPLYSIEKAKKRIIPLLRLAREHGVFVNFDLETWSTHEIVTKLFNGIITSSEFASWPHLGIVVQAYLRSSSDHLQSLLSSCKLRTAPITVRLVKGAYWDYEVLRADKLGIPCPVFQQKAQTDANYEHLSRLLLDNTHLVKPAFASHNIRSLAHAISYAKTQKVPKNNYEIQMLYGMADAEKKVLRDRGHRVRLYIPIGEMLPGMSYLVRRLLENTSQMGFIKMSRHDNLAEQLLLEAPRIEERLELKKPAATFYNEPMLDFTDPKVREQFSKSINDIGLSLPRQVPIMIGAKLAANGTKVERVSPNDQKLIVSHVSFATLEHADKAIKQSLEAFPFLNAQGVQKRAQHLMALANIMKEDIFELCAIICHEVGKTWNEAAADVAEAIDFCRYYAAQACEDLRERCLGTIGGEDNILSYEGRGPTVIIAPWNFPLAIITGMTVAPYVSGNPVIIKPAEQSSLTAFYLYERMLRAGFEADACHFLPGVGEEIGAYLAQHPSVANLCFTGSMAVGHKILQVANTVSEEQIQIKRIICEMGGKNAIIVDDDADLDEAVTAIIKSAFLYAGQKCSAASRVIAVGDIEKILIERIVDAASSMQMGSSINASTFMGPVIDQEAKIRLEHSLEKLRRDPSITVLYEGSYGEGFFVPPMIIQVSDQAHWVMQEELFGPILAIYKAADLDQAIQVANNTKYALTGALFSRSPDNIAKAKKRFAVGNLYINQKCTGALVNRQPFGGFKQSGTGIKAGGPHYVLNFVDSKCISENTMRRGFAPDGH